MVTREEFDMLRLEVEALRRLVSKEHAERLDEHDERLVALQSSFVEMHTEVRAMASQVGRLSDLVTPLSLSLPRVERNVSRLVEILEPRTVVVDGGQ